MQITPSARSSFLAGFCLSIVGWLTLFKLDPLAKFLHVERWIKQETVMNWMSENKVLTLLFTEFFNYGIHGITSTTATTFALGSTAFNAIAIFGGLPLRSYTRKMKKRNALLYPGQKNRVISWPRKKAA